MTLDRLYTPWRLAYVTGAAKSSDCVFCAAPEPFEQLARARAMIGASTRARQFVTCQLVGDLRMECGTGFYLSRGVTTVAGWNGPLVRSAGIGTGLASSDVTCGGSALSIGCLDILLGKFVLT